jgi:hypothetical protein
MLLVVTRDDYSPTGWADLGLHRLGFSGWGLALLTPLVIEYLGGESGLLTLLSAIIVSAWLLYLLKKRPQPVASAI